MLLMYILKALTWTHTSQMEEYWSHHERVPPNDLTTPSTPDDASDDASTGVNDSIVSDYDHYRQTLVANEDTEGWAAELQRYLKDMPANITKDTDIIKWWQVSCLFIWDPNHSLIGQSHAESLSAISNTGSYCT